MSKAITSCKKALAYLLTAAMVLGMAVTSPITAVEVKAVATATEYNAVLTVKDTKGHEVDATTAFSTATITQGDDTDVITDNTIKVGEDAAALTVTLTPNEKYFIKSVDITVPVTGDGVEAPEAEENNDNTEESYSATVAMVGLTAEQLNGNVTVEVVVEDLSNDVKVTITDTDNIVDESYTSWSKEATDYKLIPANQEIKLIVTPGEGKVISEAKYEIDSTEGEFVITGNEYVIPASVVANAVAAEEGIAITITQAEGCKVTANTGETGYKVVSEGKVVTEEIVAKNSEYKFEVQDASGNVVSKDAVNVEVGDAEKDADDSDNDNGLAKYTISNIGTTNVTIAVSATTGRKVKTLGTTREVATIYLDEGHTIDVPTGDGVDGLICNRVFKFYVVPKAGKSLNKVIIRFNNGDDVGYTVTNSLGTLSCSDGTNNVSWVTGSAGADGVWSVVVAKTITENIESNVEITAETETEKVETTVAIQVEADDDGPKLGALEDSDIEDAKALFNYIDEENNDINLKSGYKQEWNYDSKVKFVVKDKTGFNAEVHAYTKYDDTNNKAEVSMTPSKKTDGTEYTIAKIEEAITITVDYTWKSQYVTVTQNSEDLTITVTDGEESSADFDPDDVTTEDDEEDSKKVYRVQANKKVKINVKGGGSESEVIVTSNATNSGTPLSDGRGDYVYTADKNITFDAKLQAKTYKVWDTSEDGYHVIAKIGDTWKDVPKKGKTPIEVEDGKNVQFRVFKGEGEENLIESKDMLKEPTADKYDQAMYAIKVGAGDLAEDGIDTTKETELVVKGIYVKGDIEICVKSQEVPVAKGMLLADADGAAYKVVNATETSNKLAETYDDDTGLEGVKYKNKYTFKIYKASYDGAGDVDGYVPCSDSNVRVRYQVAEDGSEVTDTSKYKIATSEGAGVYSVPADEVTGAIFIIAERTYTVNVNVGTGVNVAADAANGGESDAGYIYGTTGTDALTNAKYLQAGVNTFVFTEKEVNSGATSGTKYFLIIKATAEDATNGIITLKANNEVVSGSNDLYEVPINALNAEGDDTGADKYADVTDVEITAAEEEFTLTINKKFKSENPVLELTAIKGGAPVKVSEDDDKAVYTVKKTGVYKLKLSGRTEEEAKIYKLSDVEKENITNVYEIGEGGEWEISDFSGTPSITVGDEYFGNINVKINKLSNGGGTIDYATAKVEYYTSGKDNRGYDAIVYKQGNNALEVSTTDITNTLEVYPGTDITVKYTVDDKYVIDKVTAAPKDGTAVEITTETANTYVIPTEKLGDADDGTIATTFRPDPSNLYAIAFDFADEKVSQVEVTYTDYNGDDQTETISATNKSVLSKDGKINFVVTTVDGYKAKASKTNSDLTGGTYVSDSTGVKTSYELVDKKDKGTTETVTLSTEIIKPDSPTYFKVTKATGTDELVTISIPDKYKTDEDGIYMIPKTEGEVVVNVSVPSNYIMPAHTDDNNAVYKESSNSISEGLRTYSYRIIGKQLEVNEKGLSVQNYYNVKLDAPVKLLVKIKSNDTGIKKENLKIAGVQATTNLSTTGVEVEAGAEIEVTAEDYKVIKLDDEILTLTDGKATFNADLDIAEDKEEDTVYVITTDDATGQEGYIINVYDTTSTPSIVEKDADNVAKVDYSDTKQYAVRVQIKNASGKPGKALGTGQDLYAVDKATGEENKFTEKTEGSDKYYDYDISTPTETKAYKIISRVIDSGKKSEEEIGEITLYVAGYADEVLTDDITDNKATVKEETPQKFAFYVNDTNGEKVKNPEISVNPEISADNMIHAKLVDVEGDEDYYAREIEITVDKGAVEKNSKCEFTVLCSGKTYVFEVSAAPARELTEVKVSSNNITYRPNQSAEITVSATAKEGAIDLTADDITIDPASSNGITATKEGNKITFSGGVDKATAEFTVMVDKNEGLAQKVTVTVKDRTISNVWVGDRSLTGNLGWTLETSVDAECDLDPQFVPTANDIKVELIKDISGNAGEINTEKVDNRIIFTCDKEASGEFEVSIDGVKANRTITITFVNRKDEPGTPADAPSAYDKPEDSDLDINASGLVIEASKAYTYTGKPIQAAVKVKANPNKLVNGVDYKVTYADNVEAGEGRILVSGIGQYSGLLKDGDITFTINKKKANGFTVVAGSMSKEEAAEFDETDDSGINDKISVYDGTTKLWINDDYTIESIAKSTNGKKIDFVIKGTGNYDSTTQKKASIAIVDLKGKNDIAACDEIIIEDQKFTGSAIKISDLSVTVGGKPVDSANYSVTYKNNKEVGVATVTIKGKKDYAGTKVATFKIVSPEVDTEKDVTITINNGKAMTYTGKLLKPSVKVQVTVDGKVKTLSKNRDYVVYYNAELNAGEGWVIIRGLGSYEEVLGYKDVSFPISKADFKKVSIKKDKSTKKSGVYFNNKKLVADEDFTAEVTGYDSRTKKYTVTVKAFEWSRNFSNTATKTIKGAKDQIDWVQLGLVDPTVD